MSNKYLGMKSKNLPIKYGLIDFRAKQLARLSQHNLVVYIKV